MLIEKYKIQQHNQELQDKQQRSFEYIAENIPNVEAVLQKLTDFQVAIPSWALGTGGTRFGRFAGSGEPRSLEEKIEDVGLLHALNQSSGSISLHIPWDIPENYANIKALAAQNGLKFDAVNSNTFQDQKEQPHSYKFGSLNNVDKATRQQAIDHNVEVIKHCIELGSEALTVWLADGSSFPGQLNFRNAFDRTVESLQEIYAALPDNWKLYLEYKAFEPNFY
ncbi:MAG: sugar isomerase, partial [Hymenobacter sp.]